MKILVKIIIISVISSLFSCSDEIMNEIGENPNDPISVPSKLLVSQATLTTAFEIAGADLAWYTSVFSEHTVGVHGQLETADKRTGINSTIGSNSWNGAYAGTLKDLEIIIELCSDGGSEAGNNTTLGIAKVLKAYTYSVLTDIFGEIPYTEALTDAKAPMFDNQDIVYEGIISLLNEAIIDLGRESIGDPGIYDFYYQGDAASWTRAAYALKARYLNRLSNRSDLYPGLNDSILVALNNSFSESANNMTFTSFGLGSTEQNPWYQEESDRAHHAVSKTLDDILIGLNDPRRDLWFALLDGSIIPAPPGSAIADQGHVLYSRISLDYLKENSPIPIITYDELLFIEAEARLRKGETNLAYTAYISGIEEAMLREGISEIEIGDYVSQSSVSVGAGNLGLSNIITQKYISFYLFNSIEAFNDYRRTGIPTLKNSQGVPPNRFPYPTDEVATNPNVPSKTSADKVWWAK